MKSLFTFLTALLVVGSFSAQAQTTPATGTMSTSSKTTTTKVSQTPATTTTTKSATVRKSGSMAQPAAKTKMKADGTPDMRYKSNKTTTTTTKTTM